MRQHLRGCRRILQRFSPTRDNPAPGWSDTPIATGVAAASRLPSTALLRGDFAATGLQRGCFNGKSRSRALSVGGRTTSRPVSAAKRSPPAPAVSGATSLYHRSAPSNSCGSLYPCSFAAPETCSAALEGTEELLSASSQDIYSYFKSVRVHSEEALRAQLALPEGNIVDEGGGLAPLPTPPAPAQPSSGLAAAASGPVSSTAVSDFASQQARIAYGRSAAMRSSHRATAARGDSDRRGFSRSEPGGDGPRAAPCATVGAATRVSCRHENCLRSTSVGASERACPCQHTSQPLAESQPSSPSPIESAANVLVRLTPASSARGERLSRLASEARQTRKQMRTDKQIAKAVSAMVRAQEEAFRGSNSIEIPGRTDSASCFPGILFPPEGGNGGRGQASTSASTDGGPDAARGGRPEWVPLCPASL